MCSRHAFRMQANEWLIGFRRDANRWPAKSANLTPDRLREFFGSEQQRGFEVLEAKVHGIGNFCCRSQGQQLESSGGSGLVTGPWCWGCSECAERSN